MSGYSCSRCGAEAYYDGRCGDGPVLLCGCDRIGSRYVDEGSRGGYHTNPTGARPVSNSESNVQRNDEYEDWGRR